MTNKNNNINLDSNVLTKFMDLHIHEDNMYWIFVRFLITIQTVLIYAWYVVGPNIMAVIIMALAAFISALLFKVTINTRKNSQLNFPYINKVFTKLMYKKIPTKAKDDYSQKGENGLRFYKFSNKVGIGHKFVITLFIISITINILFLIFSIIDLSCDAIIYKYFHKTLI